MCTICDSEYPAIRVEVGGQVTYPRTRGELETALGKKAVANSDLIPNDEDWKADHCFCGLDEFRTAHSAGVNLDFDYPSEGKVIPLNYHN